MRNRPWYKRYSSDFISGTISLTLEEAGAYSYVIDLMHDRGGPIPDDSQWISRVCGCSSRKWNAIRKRLIQAGKIYAKDGLISNERAEKDIDTSAKEARKLSENGAKGGRKSPEKEPHSPENNNLAEKGLKHRAHDQKPETRDTIDKSIEPDGSKNQGELLGETEPPATPFDPLAVIFGKQPGSALLYLTTNGVADGQARSVLGKWRKAHGDDAVIDAVRRASEATASEPISYIEATLRSGGGGGQAPGPTLSVVEQEHILERARENALAQTTGNAA